MAHCSLIVMCSNIGTPKIINFPLGTNGKLMVLGVPIFKHFRVICLGLLRENFLILALKCMLYIVMMRRFYE